MLPWPKPVNWVPGLEPSINGGRSGNGSGSGSAAAVARVHRVDPSMCKSALSEPALRPISLMGRRLDGPATQSHSHMPDLEAGSRQLQHPRMHSAAQTSSRKGGGHSRFFFSKTAAPSQRENVAIARKQEGLPALRAPPPRVNDRTVERAMVERAVLRSTAADNQPATGTDRKADGSPVLTTIEAKLERQHSARDEPRGCGRDSAELSHDRMFQPPQPRPQVKPTALGFRQDGPRISQPDIEYLCFGETLLGGTPSEIRSAADSAE